MKITASRWLSLVGVQKFGPESVGEEAVAGTGSRKSRNREGARPRLAQNASVPVTRDHIPCAVVIQRLFHIRLPTVVSQIGISRKSNLLEKLAGCGHEPKEKKYFTNHEFGSLFVCFLFSFICLFCLAVTDDWSYDSQLQDCRGFQLHRFGKGTVPLRWQNVSRCGTLKTNRWGRS